MQNHWNLGRWLGIPVSTDWTLLLAFAWLFVMTGNAMQAIAGSLALVVVLLGHEFGHVAMARWRRVAVYAITINGMHGETARGYARGKLDEIIVAWGGVLAQLLILALALLLLPLLPVPQNAWLGDALTGVYTVWTRWNILLLVIALLPFSTLDGSVAWQIVPYLRERLKRRPVTPPKTGSDEKVVQLDAARRRALKDESAKAAADIIERLKKK